MVECSVEEKEQRKRRGLTTHIQNLLENLQTSTQKYYENILKFESKD